MSSYTAGLTQKCIIQVHFWIILRTIDIIEQLAYRIQTGEKLQTC
jgi:hypothetical protein